MAAPLGMLLKKDEVLTELCRCAPAAWPKLRRACRLFGWRLDDKRSQALQLQLVEDLQLTYADMHELCEIGDAESVWILLAQGMSPTMRDREGATLLQKATHSGRTAIVRLLIEKGGPVNAKGAYGYTALHEACYLGHMEVVNHLLKMSANVDALSKNGSTPLLVAAREGRIAVCDLLLLHHAHPDDGGDRGWSPLAVAAGGGHAEVCSALVRAGGNVHGFVGDGSNGDRSALQEAAEQGYADVVALLLELKADPSYTCNDGDQRLKACDLAKRQGHLKVAAMLSSPQ